jgi:hypothetical protein
MKRTLQAILVALAAVMVLAGVLGVILGADLVLGDDAFSASVDSEFRFFAAWYLAAGVLLLRAVPKVETAAFEVRFVGITFFVAACGRVLSMIDVGAPHGFYIALTAIEFAIPLVIVPMQAAVARRT